MLNPVTKEKKIVAKYVAKAFGGTFHVREYVDDSEKLAVDLLRCDYRPFDGVTSYSTIGLSDYPILWGEKEFPTRLELAGACFTSAETFPNILASAAFRMMRTAGIYHPGAVVKNYVRQYFPSSPLPHLYFTTPFSWENLTTFDSGTKKVTWLQVMPISDNEYGYLKECGDKAMENMFKVHQIDVFNVNRPSVL